MNDFPTLTDEDRKCILDSYQMSALDVLNIIRAADPKLALCRLLLERNNRDRRGHVGARCVLMLSGETTEAADSIIEILNKYMVP